MEGFVNLNVREGLTRNANGEDLQICLQRLNGTRDGTAKPSMVAGLNASTPFVSSVSIGGITHMSEVTAPHQSATEVCNNNTINATKGLTQSPLVSPTAPLHLYQSSVDVAATFEVLLTTVGDLEVLIKDINAGKHEELLSRMTNDKRKVVVDALGVMCKLIEAQSASNLPNDGFNFDGTRNASSVPVTLHMSSHVEDVYEFNDSCNTLKMGRSEILWWRGDDGRGGGDKVKMVVVSAVVAAVVAMVAASIDDVAALFGVPLISLKEIDEFTKDFEVGKYALWSKLTKETRSGINDIICYRWDTLLNMQKSAPIVMIACLAFFFFKFDLRAGLEAVLEGGPWLIRNSSIILKKWSMDTRLLKEELTRIPIWVKLHDVPLQVFEEDGISLIATFIGKHVMLDSHTSFMCNNSWGRSSFARCLIEVNLKADLVDVVIIGVPSLTRDDFTKETIRVEATNVGNASKSSSMLKTAGTFSEKDDITTSNSYSVLNDEEEDEEENVENVYDESANLFTNTKTGGSSSFTSAAWLTCLVESFVLVTISCL
nr:zinc knuckle CX2CX4HX4C [Tanacetum cinerariifolium]